jgi:hypothetical protein
MIFVPAHVAAKVGKAFTAPISRFADMISGKAAWVDTVATLWLGQSVQEPE